MSLVIRCFVDMTLAGRDMVRNYVSQLVNLL